MDGGEAGQGPVRNGADGQLKVALEPVADGEGQKENHRHDGEKDRNAPHPAGEDCIGPLGQNVLALLVNQDLVDDLTDEIVFSG